jgi:hypothetical protein
MSCLRSPCRWLATFGFALAPLLVSRAEPPATPSPFAVQPGEEFHFNVSWGIFRRAGEIQIRADTDGERGHRVTVAISSRGAVRGLYRYDSFGQSWFDPVTGKIERVEYQEEAGSRQRSRVMEFDYASGHVHYQDLSDPDDDRLIPIPEGQPLDLISSLISARQWNLQPGQSRDVVVQADDHFFALRLHAEAVDVLSTAQGSVPAVRIVPEPIGPPEGIFRRGGKVEIWVGQEGQRLPLRIHLHMRWGTAVANLVRYQPPPGLALPAIGEAPPETESRHAPPPTRPRRGRF